MQRDDEFRLKHMLEAAEEAVSFIKGKSLDDFNNNRQLALAVLKDIEIIGEAANKVSKETQLQHKNIPWAAIIGMRHRLIHTYFDINFEQVWKTTAEELPVLIQKLQTIVD